MVFHRFNHDLVLQRGLGHLHPSGAAHGRVRQMYNDLGRSITEAGPVSLQDDVASIKVRVTAKSPTQAEARAEREE